MGDDRAVGASPVRPQLSSAQLERLRHALASHGGKDGHDGEISRALRTIGAEARATGVKAEQLVASLKRIFDSLTPPPTLATQEIRAQRLAHLVTICVREYYAPSSDSPSDGSSSAPSSTS